ncbi:rod shape-determining protein RodA [Pyruvatibacter mobilis]|jgi:rod shape determining protein RodA|uniref:Peptidoglycan glycosyltransferase MrdB n=1 Tax=Pyruvatibacter mobilis TaxID=1712261 RepID=A0A845QEW8_9HYPH|nr:rod shape-determining protein RodA [Pyruvatibacter mobilis]NBG96561.1 rod shape-determining protein RodA [Pyruvatibacter mobilis]QJD74554.1 rod shape-determining protein RodA [Pyruvatibacter mobilis]GGD08026.1 rod shape-determining protein RodA [Pyruvatibacter mobilis]
MVLEAISRSGRLSLGDKLYEINWGFVLLLTAIASVGFAMLYSAADGNFDPWASRQMVRFAMGMVLLMVFAVIDPRVWMQLAYPAYGFALLLLIGVEVAGTTGMGATRWINLGVIQLQPSELMKITLALALARYYHMLEHDRVSHPLYLLPALAMIGLPVLLVLRQPDLGTSLLLTVVGIAIIFMAGLSWRYVIGAGVAALIAIPVGWQYFLLPYQRERVFTFLDPSRDPLGAGYHTTQAKIALGSGGVWGKGFMEGTQSHLNFLPEKQTDFIFVMLSEEMGLMGGLALMGLYLAVLGFAFSVAVGVRHQFGRLLVAALAVNFFLYVFINAAMVMGLIPVVGVPLPLVSYGGSAMLVIMAGFGLMMSIYVHRQEELPRGGGIL